MSEITEQIAVIELIVLLNGAIVPIMIPVSRKNYFNELLAQATAPDAPQGTLLSLGDDYRIMTDKIVGWYYRPFNKT